MVEGEDGALEGVKRKLAQIGEGVLGLGSATKKAPESIGRTLVERRFGRGETEDMTLSERLQDLKRLEVETPSEEAAAEEEWEEWEEEEERWEEERWEGRGAELERPFSERWADIFYGIFRGISDKLAKFYFFVGLESDLRRANMDFSVEKYISILLSASVISLVGGFLLVWLLFGSVLMGILLGSLAFFVPVIFGRIHPKSKVGSRGSEIDQQIPYALRHMSTQLSAGIGLPETITSVAKADYGVLSEEFRRAALSMRRGKSMDKALEEVQDRVDSDPLTRAIRQIRRTLRSGGNLARTLGLLSEEVSLSLRMKLRDYTQSLNVMTMMYMFGSAVIPPMLIVLMVVMGFMGGGLLPSGMAPILFLIMIPTFLLIFVRIFKKMEPAV